MRRALLLDTETTGLDPATEQVIEVGACLYDLELGCPIESYAAVILAESNPAEHVNKIPAALLVEGQFASVVWDRVVDLADRAEVIAAHNAEFDRSFVDAAAKGMQQSEVREFARAGDRVSGSILKKSWVCTMSDFAWEGSGRKLVEIALNLGLGVASAHRALTDVDTMARIFTRVKERGGSLPEMFKRAARPKKRFVAMVSYEMRHIAKDAGFHWDGRSWWRMMPPEDAEALTFRVVQRDA